MKRISRGCAPVTFTFFEMTTIRRFGGQRGWAGG